MRAELSAVPISTRNPRSDDYFQPMQRGENTDSIPVSFTSAFNVLMIKLVVSFPKSSNFVSYC